MRIPTFRGLQRLALCALAAVLVLSVFFVTRGLAASPTIPGAVASSVAKAAGGAVVLAPATTPSSIASIGLADYVDVQSGDQYRVDSSGLIARIVYKASMNRLSFATKGSLSDAQLVAAVRAYGAQHFPELGVATMTPTVLRTLAGVDESGVEHYDVSVELRGVVNDVPSPNFLRALVNPGTGEVAMVMHDDGPISCPASANLTRAAAISMAAVRGGMPVRSSEEASLAMVRVPGERSVRLVWQVVLRTGDSRFGSTAWATVDARDGSLVQLIQD